MDENFDEGLYTKYWGIHPFMPKNSFTVASPTSIVKITPRKSTLRRQKHPGMYIVFPDLVVQVFYCFCNPDLKIFFGHELPPFLVILFH